MCTGTTKVYTCGTRRDYYSCVFQVPAPDHPWTWVTKYINHPAHNTSNTYYHGEPHQSSNR